MNFKITASRFLSAPTAKTWAIASSFAPGNADIYRDKGQIFALVAMSAKDIDLPQNENLIVGKEVLTRLQELYYNTKNDPFTSLQMAVEKIHTDFSSPNENLHLALCAVIQNKIIFASFGQVETWVKRHGQLAKITSASDSLQTSSGALIDKDIFYLGTLDSFTSLTPEVLMSPEIPENLFTLKVEAEILPIPQLQNSTQLEVPVARAPKTISSIRLGIARLIDRVLVMLPNNKNIIKKDLVNPEVGKRKLATIVGVILLVLLASSVVFGTRAKQKNALKSKIDPVINSVTHDLDESVNLSAANESQARSLILKAKKDLENLQKENIKDPRINELQAKASDLLGKIAGVYEEEPSLYLDLALQTAGFKGTSIAASVNRMVVLDRVSKKLISIDLDSKKTETIAGPDIMPSANDLSVYSDRNFVSSDNGIWEIGDSARPVIQKDWGTNILTKAYTGNFYILDKDAGKLWRYQGDGGIFANKSNWFSEGVTPNLSNVISLAIDGNIWLLTKSGDLLRFSSGNPIDFSIKDVDTNFHPVDFYTDEDTKYLYFLDKENSRILVTDKDGNYKAEYVGNNIKTVDKIIVSESNQKIILLSGSNLYSLEIKHL